MANDKYEVIKYTEANLLESLDLGLLEKDDILKKRHFTYLCEYLGNNQGIQAVCIVIEKRYVSKAYLSDYSSYYSSCFQDYDRFCRRVHFFNVSFSEEEFMTLILDEDSEVLQNSYLGHVVVKPLPGSLIGPTLLKPYRNINQAGHRRSYTACRKYSVSLFGRALTINTLAFQEQDAVVSACATTAIWSAFHRTSELFQTRLPSPSEITKSAGNVFVNTGRTFPNQGLTIEQICKTVEEIGLVSELRNATNYRSDMTHCKRFIYAYSKAGIPILLFIRLKDIGGHLVVVNGFSENPQEIAQSPEISLVADKIERLYVHDDQVGPFSRYGFVANTAIETPWLDDKGDFVSAWIHHIIVPIHPKIRISFDDVFKKINILDNLVSFYIPNIDWDIYLTSGNDYKKELLSNPDASDHIKSKNCLAGQAKYIWLAQAKIKGQMIFELIFDSTDISHGHFCSEFNLYDLNFRETLLDLFKTWRAAIERKEISLNGVIYQGLNLGKKMYEKVIVELEIEH